MEKIKFRSENFKCEMSLQYFINLKQEFALKICLFEYVKVPFYLEFQIGPFSI